MGLTTPNHQTQLLKNQGDPHGGEHLPQLLPTQPAQEHSPLDHAQERDGPGPGEDGEEKMPGLPDHRQPNVAPKQVVGAMRHIDDTHHAKDERQPASEQKQQCAI